MPHFTLKLSRERIQLLLINENGDYEEIGSADPNEQNITDSLQILRGQVNALTDNTPLIDVMLPEELILVQNLTIDSVNSPISKVKATALVASACDLNEDEINISVGSPTSHRTQPIAAVTTKTIDETRFFLNNAGFKTRRFMAEKPISGFEKEPVFLEDPKLPITLISSKNTILSGVSIFTFLLLATVALFAVKPSQQLKVSNQINENVTTALSIDYLPSREINESKPKLSIKENLIPNMTSQYLPSMAKLSTKDFQPTTTSIKNALNKPRFHPNISKSIISNKNILDSNLPISQTSNSSLKTQIMPDLKSRDLRKRLTTIQPFPTPNKYFSFHKFKSIVQNDYQKLIKLDLNNKNELNQITSLGEIRAPIKRFNRKLIISKSFSQPRFISLASIDHHNLKKSHSNYHELNTTIGSNFKSYSTLSNQGVIKLQNTDSFLNRTILSKNLEKQNSGGFNDFNLTPEQIQESKQYIPLIRPKLISKINVLKEPTLSSGAVTLSNVPLVRPNIVVVLSHLNPNEVKIVAKATKRPSFPRRASVANNATISNIIELNRTNLIGIFGTENNAIALIRLASGRVIKVKVGDRFDGWKVLTIYKDKIELANGKKQETLRLPG